MNLRYSLLFIFLMVSPIMAEHDSTTIHHDPWFAYDKVLHFGVSCSIVLSTHYVLSEKMNIHDEVQDRSHLIFLIFLWLYGQILDLLNLVESDDI